MTRELKTFLVKSGPGYFVEFCGNTAEMHSDQAEAAWMTLKDAANTALELDVNGMAAEVVRLDAIDLMLTDLQCLLNTLAGREPETEMVKHLATLLGRCRHDAGMHLEEHA